MKKFILSEMRVFKDFERNFLTDFVEKQPEPDSLLAEVEKACQSSSKCTSKYISCRVHPFFIIDLDKKIILNFLSSQDREKCCA